MTRKDFDLIADVLKRLSAAEDMAGLTPVVARAFAEALKATNAQFNRDKFLRACGVST